MKTNTLCFTEKLRGAMVGSAVGDAIGKITLIRMDDACLGGYVDTAGYLAYTDDTAMAIGLAESLANNGKLIPQEIGEQLRYNYQREPWRGYRYGPPTVFSLVEKEGLTVQNFVSAAAGMAMLVALIRGLARHNAATVGNFWVDLTRTILSILLPLSLLLAVALVSQGVVQTFAPYQRVALLQPTVDDEGNVVTEQLLALGPAASQIAIKQLGTNGGGFFNVNSAHPFENATPFSNLLEVLSILLIPAALCYTFGKMVGETRQGWALLTAMTLILAVFLVGAYAAEAAGNPRLAALGIDQQSSLANPGGNMEGKEVRFGIANAALWATATTAASNGSVNSMHDSYTPLGGLVPLILMQLGEVVFGGVGSGLYGMLAFVIVAVFIAGRGTTPDQCRQCHAPTARTRARRGRLGLSTRQAGGAADRYIDGSRTPQLDLT